MGKYCAKCGKELNEGVKFCPACGAPVSTQTPVQGAMNGQGQNQSNVGMSNGQEIPIPQTTVKKSSTGKIVVAVLAGIVLICGLFFAGSKIMTPGYVKPVKQFEKGINQAEYSKIKDSLSPGIFDKLLGEYSWIMSYMDDDKIDEYMQQALESEFGDGETKVSLKVTDKERIKADDLSYELYNSYNVSDSDAEKATDAYSLTVKVGGDASDDDEQSTVQLVVIKIDGEWKIASLPF